MFRIVENKLLFTFEDRDLAYAFADMEGYLINEKYRNTYPPTMLTPGVFQCRIEKKVQDD